MIDLPHPLATFFETAFPTRSWMLFGRSKGMSWYRLGPLVFQVAWAALAMSVMGWAVFGAGDFLLDMRMQLGIGAALAFGVFGIEFMASMVRFVLAGFR